MAQIKNVELVRDRNLLDPDFSGYKLSLDSLGVSSSSLANGPVHTLPSADMYSFLHAKMFGEHNHLIVDTYNEDSVYFVSGCGYVYHQHGEEETPTEVWQLPESGKERSYNPALTFPAPNLAILSDGTGTMFILDTGDRKTEIRQWTTMFQDAVCGKDRPFEVRYGVLSGEELEVVLQYVEEREKMDNAEMLPPQSTGESSFFNCLEWISFSRVNKDWMMERVRRVISHGGYNYVSVVGGKLALSAEKRTVLAFDSLHPVEGLSDVDLETKKKDEEPAKFYWKQTPEDIEIWFYILPDTTRHQVKIDIGLDSLEVRLSGNLLLQGTMLNQIEKDTWTWTLENGKLGIMMAKDTEGPWASVWRDVGGPKGIEVTDLTEDVVLPHLTTDNPIDAALPAEPAFNSQELESVDDCIEENSLLVWQEDANTQHVANLAGQQHLMVVEQQADQPPALCIRQDVDGFVWKIRDCTLEHVSTFPALGYVQAGKQSRKFITAPHTFSYSAICDASRHVYIYRQPKPLDSGSELRNRKSGRKVEGVAVQQVVTLENNEDILGFRATPLFIFVLTRHSLYRIRVNNN